MFWLITNDEQSGLEADWCHNMFCPTTQTSSFLHYFSQNTTFHLLILLNCKVPMKTTLTTMKPWLEWIIPQTKTKAMTNALEMHSYSTSFHLRLKNLFGRISSFDWYLIRWCQDDDWLLDIISTVTQSINAWHLWLLSDSNSWSGMIQTTW